MSEDKCSCNHPRTIVNNGAVYGMGFIGALIYFLQHATSFMTGVIGVLKAVFWPVLLVYKALELLKM